MAKTNFKTFDELPVCLRPDDVAGALGISRTKAYALVRTEGFPRIVTGKRIIIPKDAFIKWINSQTMVSEV